VPGNETGQLIPMSVRRASGHFRRAQDGDPTLADDRLEGAVVIAVYYYQDNSRRNRKRIYRAAKRGTLPIGKGEGGRLVASKRKLSAAYERITNGT